MVASRRNDPSGDHGGSAVGVLIIDHFCDEVDFFSIGSNDMISICMQSIVITRAYRRCITRYAIVPAHVAADCYRCASARQWVGICGELGGESCYLPLLLGWAWMS